MPKPPMPAKTLELFRQPNPAVVAVLTPEGQPVSVATWYLVEDDGRVLVNMDGERARVSWMRAEPRVALTALKDGEWYTHVSIRGRVVEWRDDVDLVDIDRLSTHYGGKPYPARDRASGERPHRDRPLARLGRREGEGLRRPPGGDSRQGCDGTYGVPNRPSCATSVTGRRPRRRLGERRSGAG